MQHGIQERHAKVFFDEVSEDVVGGGDPPPQEIDGPGVLVLQRQDVLRGLGVKLGPALRIYNRIRALQTRRNLEV